MTNHTNLIERLNVEELACALCRAAGDGDGRDEYAFTGKPTWTLYEDTAADALAYIEPIISTLIEGLRAHIAEQITHAETRIQDGVEMGATVWRIALEDVARENRATLTKGDSK